MRIESDQNIYLKNFLKAKDKYFFEKTEISEIASRPSSATFDLLKKIYSNNGPVANVYKKYGINYIDTGFLQIIGNELFVDKEKEIQGLLPAYSYFKNKDLTPKFCYFSTILPTARNLFFLNTIKTKNYKIIFDLLKEKIELPLDDELNIKKNLENFLQDYEIIFETNLLAGLAIKKAKLFLKKEPLDFSDLLSGNYVFVDLGNYHIKSPANLIGNSLELSDESNFSGQEKLISMPSEKIKTWWNGLSKYKKKALSGIIAEAVIYSRLREFGRWLAVKNINSLRICLQNIAKEKGFGDLKNIFFVNLKDVFSGKINEESCIKNKNIYESYNKFSFPNSINSTQILLKEIKNMAVSPGLAEGVLTTVQSLISEEQGNNKTVLYTELLSPDLTQYFDKISGIVASRGSMLSHLAIMARESGIPVVVGFSIGDGNIKLGDNVEINGDTGNISKI